MSQVPAAASEGRAEQLRQEMRCIRRELGENVEELVVQAERLMDWRYYVHRYPWASIGVAAFLGYFFVPGRTVVLPANKETIARLVEHIPAAVKQPDSKKSTLLGTLFSLGAGLLGRAAVGFATQQVQKMMAQPAPARPTHPVEAH